MGLQRGLQLLACACLIGFTLYLLASNQKQQGKLFGSHAEHSAGGDENGPEQRVKRLPEAIIVGCRKAGTRALLRFLALNPKVRAAPREMHFFDRPANYRLGLGWYRQQMPASNVGELTIEKSPAYFVTKQAPERILAMNSSIKLVVIFRNPVNRLVSDFSQLVANRINSARGQVARPGQEEEDEDGHEGELSWDCGKLDGVSEGVSGEQKWANETAWLRAEAELESHVLRPDGGVDDQQRIVRAGMYSMHLERWLSLFNRRQMHFVDGEKLISHPAEQLQKLEHFLGLSPHIRSEHFVFNPRKGFFCLNGTTIEQDKHKEAGEGHQAAAGCQKSRCLSKSKGRRHVRVSDELLEKLSDFYAPYNEYLRELTGIKFDN